MVITGITKYLHLAQLPLKKSVKPGRLFSGRSVSYPLMALKSEVRKLFERVRWISGAVTWSVRFANHGPAWLPVRLRVIPLQLVAKIIQLHV